MNPNDARRRFSQLRFAIIGSLLAQPPEPGDLHAALARLAAQSWQHPLTGEPLSFGVSTLERWYYRARKDTDPVAALRAQQRTDAGQQRRMPAALALALREQYRLHPAWSVQLHYDNLAVQLASNTALGPLPSYATLRRYLKAQGLSRQPRRREINTPGQRLADARLAHMEVRSFEASFVHGLWHADYHTSSRAVLTRHGQWVKPHLLCILDDHSRLVCHLQWYLHETAETCAHALMQALLKRALPRALMTDNGSPFIAAEVVEGLERLGILHETTLPRSPYQNGKQEVFWGAVEGRLLAMLDDVEDLTLDLLNAATQAWVEGEYNRKLHSEIHTTPLQRALSSRSVGRPSPAPDAVRAVFRTQTTRRQRKTDGTVSLSGARFEVPARYRQIEVLTLRYARWDLTHVDLIDPRSGHSLCPLYPLDRQRNADGERRRLEPTDPAQHTPSLRTGELAPLLRQLIADYAATGMPPAYLPFPEQDLPQ